MDLALRANSGSSDYAAGLFGSCCNEKEMSLGGSVMWWEQLLEGKEQATHKPTSEAFLVGGGHWNIFCTKRIPTSCKTRR